uniref:Uncharacterized protein n=1 Tax=Equus asinus asinus TaxID=83772 RepID=A0A8C4MN65_EQUAS
MLFPSFFAGLYMPTHSPGTAGRSTRPEARSYSSKCFRTAKGQQGWFKSRSGDTTLASRGWRRGMGEGQRVDSHSFTEKMQCPRDTVNNKEIQSKT